MDSIDAVQEILQVEANKLAQKLKLCGDYPRASSMQKRMSRALALRLSQTQKIASLLGIDLEEQDD